MVVNIEDYLYDVVKQTMNCWDWEKDMYAISFLVYSNEAFVYNDLENLCEFSISYNTESFAKKARKINQQYLSDDLEDEVGPYDEERWDYTQWQQNDDYIIEVGNGPDTANEHFPVLLQWYHEQGIDDPGEENDEEAYPIGCLKLCEIAAKIACRLQEEGFIKQNLGKEVPILIQGLEYDDVYTQYTEDANPHHEADVFLEYMRF